MLASEQAPTRANAIAGSPAPGQQAPATAAPAGVASSGPATTQPTTQDAQGAPVAAAATAPAGATAQAATTAAAGPTAQAATTAAAGPTAQAATTAAAGPTAAPSGAEQAADAPASQAPAGTPHGAPGPPADAAAGQHAAAPAHVSSPLAGSVPVDVGQVANASQPPAPVPAPTAAAAEHRPGVLLSEAAETVRLTISAANAQGVSRARIALRPAELGGIEIMLAHGPAGLSATLMADTAHAAQALQRAADELQRSLAGQGLNLVSLEIGVAGDGPAARGREDRDGSADDHGTRQERVNDRETDDPTAARTLELPTGVLVDVLA